MHFHSSRGARLVVPAAAVLAAAVGYVTLLPAQAANNLQVIANLVTCGTATACVAGSNTSTGPGVQGNSAKGSGTVGQTTFNSTTSSNGQNGVLGQDLSTSGTFDVGVRGTSKLGVGVFGTSTSGDAIDAHSSTGYGLRAFSSVNPAVGGFSSKGGAGVLGQSVSGPGVKGTSTSGDGVDGLTSSAFGVYGSSNSNDGVFGNSNSSIGVEGDSSSYIGVFGSSGSYIALYGEGFGGNDGVYGYSNSGNGLEGNASGGDAVHAVNTGTGTAVAALATTGDAIYATTGGGIGAYVRNSNGNGSDITGSYIGLLGRAPAGTSTFPLTLTDQNGNDLFYVDGAGNVFYHGGLFNFAKTPGGATATEYVTNAATPTVEDTGSAQLVNGQAVVKLDPAFAATIEMQHPYRVFLTPGGDTRGLYVAAKTLSGFIVRETQGGHSTLTFDYRISANAVGRGNERMTLSPALRGMPNAQLVVQHVGRTTAPLPRAARVRANTPH